MFVMTNDWLMEYYGSELNQVEQAKGWLLQYGKNVTVRQIEKWKYYKHLAEYQVNTNDIVRH
jgi:hypothetical protein